jgi:hypothetical protein
MGRGGVYTGFWWGNLRERDHLEDPDVDGRIIFKWIFRKWDLGEWTGLIWPRIRDRWGGGTCKRDSEPSGPVKCVEFLDWLRTD